MYLKKTAAALAVVLALASLPALGGEYGNAVFFGDSLTDSGYYKPLLPLPGVGKFTTNPGPVWSEIMAASLGFQANPSNTPGGTNYAQGGARVDATPGVGGGPATGAQPISTQVSSYLSANGNRANPAALYVVWAGANDIFAASSSPASAQGTVLAAATADVQQIARLRAAGARYIVVPSLPDMGLTPAGLAAGPAGSAGMTQLSSGYNQLLFGGLAAAGIRVIPADTFTFLREVAASPASYGFGNATGVACTTSSSLVCTSASLVSPNADRTYMFADGVHPSSAGHELIAGYFGSIVAAPTQVSLLAESPVQTRQALTHDIGEQLRVSNRNRAANTSRIWAGGSVGRLEYDESGSARDASGTPWSGIVGLDRKYSDNLLAGLAFGYGQYNGDFGGGSGDYTQREWSLSAFGEYTVGAWRLSAVGTYGNLDYDVDRAVRLGPTKRKMSASTDGDNLSLVFFGNYEMKDGNLTHGPWAGLQLQWIDVDGFRESGGSTALRFGSQSRNSTVGSVGYRLTLDAGDYVPFASVALNHEFRDTDRNVTASLTSMTASSFALPGVKTQRDWATLAAGVSVRLTPTTTALVAGSAEVGRGDVTDYRVHAGVNFQF